MVQVPLAEVPAEGEARDELAVHPLVVLEAVDGLGHETRQRATVQVHEAEAHDLADEADGGAAVVEAIELVVDPRGARREPGRACGSDSPRKSQTEYAQLPA